MESAMSSNKLYLKKAEENLYASLKAGETSDEQIKTKVLRAISEVQGALDIIRKRDQNKYQHDNVDDDDMWVV
jgi:hypothetical protein